MNKIIFALLGIFIISLAGSTIAVQAYESDIDYRMLSDSVILDFTIDSEGKIQFENVIIKFKGQWVDIQNESLTVLDSKNGMAWIVGNIDEQNQFYTTFVFNDDNSGEVGLWLFDSKTVTKYVTPFTIFEF